MNAKKTLKEINKALKDFEKECNNSGKLKKGVDIGFSYNCATLRAVIEDRETGFYFLMTQDLWYDNGDIEAETIQIFNY